MLVYIMWSFVAITVVISAWVIYKIITDPDSMIERKRK